jgi:hypothetical protein
VRSCAGESPARQPPGRRRYEKSLFSRKRIRYYRSGFEREKFAMRKHLYGFALFVFIAASGAALYTLLFAPLKADVPVVGDDRLVVIVREPADLEEVKPIKSPLSYELKSFHIDLESRRGTAEVQLDWNSSEKPPAEVSVEFGLTTPGEPFSGMTVGHDDVRKPFEKGRSVTKTCRFLVLGHPGPNVTSYYGYAEVTEAAGIDDYITKLVLIEKNRMAGAIPALITHPNKK